YLEENEKNDIVEKCDLYTPTGIYCFDLKNGKLVTNGNRLHQDYLTLESDDGELGFNWERIPLIPFKYNSNEQPLITRCKSIQDAINKITSDFVNGMEENAGGNSIIVLKNYGGEKLDEFRDKLSKFRAVKIDSTPERPGDIDTLEISVDSTNYDVILKLLKRQLIENCRGFDAKDDKLGGNPNQMNIKTALADLDSDANDFETEYQASLDSLLWFVNQHLANTGAGNFEDEDVEIIFNRDNIVNETEIMNMLISAGVQIPNEVLLRQVPFLDDIDEALKLLEKEDEKQQDIYGGALPANGGKNDNLQDNEQD
ncbi:MAG: phage portal protein, partial [Alphaproteobacteria bacterium]|nr:phage portal protein [Alphaproteobacteria bacterium]